MYNIINACEKLSRFIYGVREEDHADYRAVSFIFETKCRHTKGTIKSLENLSLLCEKPKTVPAGEEASNVTFVPTKP